MNSVKNTNAPLYVIGLGPGSDGLLTPVARECIEKCTVICGYTGYIELIDPKWLCGKKIITNGMMGEVARAKQAVEAALAGEPTAVVCSGDPGVYALAGLILEIIEASALHASDFPLEIIPGVPAVCAAAALLGAPLMHDFAVISLSDLLTPWDVIAKRLESAFQADFVTALYNPRSKKRADYLDTAFNFARKYREQDTPVGIVRNAFRKEQEVTVTTLANVDTTTVDMFTIVLIGNSVTRIVKGKGESSFSWEHGARILTPRGYAQKYENIAVKPAY